MELGVDVDEVRASVRPIYLDLRRFAAVVASADVDPDDLLQEALARVLATGNWRKIRDHRAYLMRKIVDAAPSVRGHLVDAGAGSVTEVTLVATLPPDLDQLDAVTRALLYLVEVDDYVPDEAAAVVGCTADDAERRLARVTTRPRLEPIASRGESRGADAIVDAAFTDAARREPSVAQGHARARKWTVAVALAAVVLVAAVVVVARQREDKAAPVAAPPPEVPIKVASFAESAHGWVFNQGNVRNVADDRLAAKFPMSQADSAPVRVEGGFVAVSDRSLWFARENTTDVALLDELVTGVAATPGGGSIAYATLSADGTTSTLKLLDVPTQSVISQFSLDRPARVAGISNPEVLLDTVGPSGKVAAIWDPTNGNRVTYLDAFGSVGGVGRNIAVLHEGNRSCGVLVTVRNDAIAPLRNIDLSAGDRGCDPTQWEFDVSGSLVAGYRDFEPTELRVSINRFPVSIGPTKVRDAIWVDNAANIAAIDDRNHLVRCDVSARCVDVRPVQPPPTLANQLWLIPPRRDVTDDRTG